MLSTERQGEKERGKDYFILNFISFYFKLINVEFYFKFCFISISYIISFGLFNFKFNCILNFFLFGIVTHVI